MIATWLFINIKIRKLPLWCTKPRPAVSRVGGPFKTMRGAGGLVANYYFSNYLGDVVIYYLQLLLGEKLR